MPTVLKTESSFCYHQAALVSIRYVAAVERQWPALRTCVSQRDVDSCAVRGPSVPTDLCRHGKQKSNSIEIQLTCVNILMYMYDTATGILIINALDSCGTLSRIVTMLTMQTFIVIQVVGVDSELTGDYGCAAFGAHREQLLIANPRTRKKTQPL